MVCVYEDENWGNFYPLIHLRPVFDLLFGCQTLLTKLRRRYPKERFNLWVRDELAELVQKQHPDCLVNQPVVPPVLFISAGAVLDEKLPVRGPEELFVAGQRIAGFRLNQARSWKPGFLGRVQLGLPEKKVKARVYAFIWELVNDNPQEICRELKSSSRRPHRLIRARSARVHRSAVIITEPGPVYLGAGSVVGPLSLIEGPGYIGPGTLIDRATVRAGCSFGPECRIGGEVECSIFQGYANKHHEGFIGHSYVGEWVNLGALTTCSDLKNNYRPVKVAMKNRLLDTGLLKLGCFIGDHAKTGIGTLLPTGGIISTFANWFEPGLAPKQVGPFAWGRTGRWRREEVIECARRVMARRNVTPDPAYEKLLLKIFELSWTDESYTRR
ncbi:MAG: putative sugar nucleotidyl transferase [candidate division WOR-3 bacterium]|jgi:UDP-N-acetylglucosamine diphosphorylase/glucosamine-1-phosphate N-acetyltransferase